VVKRLEAEKVKEKKNNEKELKKAQETAGKIDGEEIEIESSRKEGALYAAVSSKEIVKALKDQVGVNIKPEQIRMKKPIKEIGTHEVVVVFSHGLEADISVVVS
jgi:large subunit ribosomal protein L9